MFVHHKLGKLHSYRPGKLIGEGFHANKYVKGSIHHLRKRMRHHAMVRHAHHQLSSHHHGKKGGKGIAYPPIGGADLGFSLHGESGPSLSRQIGGMSISSKEQRGKSVMMEHPEPDLSGNQFWKTSSKKPLIGANGKKSHKKK